VAKQFEKIEEAHRDFIARQHIFFTATATDASRINISPRPTDCFRVLGPNAVAYRDLTGSGSETTAHLRIDGRMTIMFCAFDGLPMILRLYGKGQFQERGTPGFVTLLNEAFAGEAPPGTRQIIRLDIDLVQTSCGYGVPLFAHAGERDNLARWTQSKDEAGLAAYRREKNLKSMDGLPSLTIG
jgi:Pyridoxamine 5'-phosphate oxidase